MHSAHISYTSSAPSVFVVGYVRRQSHGRVDEGENDSRCYTFQPLREIRRPPSNYREAHDAAITGRGWSSYDRPSAGGWARSWLQNDECSRRDDRKRAPVRKRKPEIGDRERSAAALDARGTRNANNRDYLWSAREPRFNVDPLFTISGTCVTRLLKFLVSKLTLIPARAFQLQKKSFTDKREFD